MTIKGVMVGIELGISGRQEELITLPVCHVWVRPGEEK